jgi:hypothetical protein
VPHVLRTVVAFVLLVVATAVLRGQDVVLAEIAGRITDAEGGVIPGVRVLITGDRLRREVVTDNHGRFVVRELALGTYRVEATLSGFLPRAASITLSSTTPRAQISWSMEIGCLVEAVRVSFTPQAAAPLVESIVHIRVEADQKLVSWSWHPECTVLMQSYRAVVLNEKPQRALELFLRPDDDRLQPGQEYLAFIWPESRTGDGLVYPVVSGRVATSAPAPLGGMRVDDALALIKTWAKR